MTKTVEFDKGAFRRGVEDVLSLAPLRDAASSALSKCVGKSSPTARRTQGPTGAAGKTRTFIVVRSTD